MVVKQNYLLVKEIYKEIKGAKYQAL